MKIVKNILIASILSLNMACSIDASISMLNSLVIKSPDREPPITDSGCVFDCTNSSLKSLSALRLKHANLASYSILDDYLYVGGNFDTSGARELEDVHTGGYKVFQNSAGEYKKQPVDLKWESFLNVFGNNAIYGRVLGSDNYIYLVGRFPKNDGTKTGILRLNQNLEIDQSFPAFDINWTHSNGSAQAENLVDMQIIDNKLFITGSFDSVNGQARGRGASIDLVGKSLSSWNPNYNSDRKILPLVAPGVLTITKGVCSGDAKDCIDQFDPLTESIRSTLVLNSGLQTVLGYSGNKQILLYSKNLTYEIVLYVFGGESLLEVFDSSGITMYKKLLKRSSWGNDLARLDMLVQNNILYLTGTSIVGNDNLIGTGFNATSCSSNLPSCTVVNGYFSMNLSTGVVIGTADQAGYVMSDLNYFGADFSFNVTSLKENIIFFHTTTFFGAVYDSNSGAYLSKNLKDLYSVPSTKKFHTYHSPLPIELPNGNIYIPASGMMGEDLSEGSNLVRINVKTLDYEHYTMDGSISQIESVGGKLWMSISGTTLTEPDGSVTYSLTSNFVAYDPNTKQLSNINVPSFTGNYSIEFVGDGKYVFATENYILGLNINSLGGVTLSNYLIKGINSNSKFSSFTLFGNKGYINTDSAGFIVSNLDGSNESSISFTEAGLFQVYNIFKILSSYSAGDNSLFGIIPGLIFSPGLPEYNIVVKPVIKVNGDYMYISGTSQVTDSVGAFKTSVARMRLSDGAFDRTFRYQFSICMNPDLFQDCYDDLIQNIDFVDGLLNLSGYINVLDRGSGKVKLSDNQLTLVSIDLASYQLVSPPSSPGLAGMSLFSKKTVKDIDMMTYSVYGLFYTKFNSRD